MILSTDSTKVEEAERVDVPPPPSEKVLSSVDYSGNGFVGSHVCKEVLDRGLSVASISRSGRSSLQDPWANKVIWHQGNLLSIDSLKDALSGVTSMVPEVDTTVRSLTAMWDGSLVVAANNIGTCYVWCLLRGTQTMTRNVVILRNSSNG